MYYYVMSMNIAHNIWITDKQGVVDSDISYSSITNQANLSYQDRDFLEAHVFKRGYPSVFCDVIRKKWKMIDAGGGKPLGMDA